MTAWVPDPSRMPTRLLVEHIRTSAEQAIWEQLPEGMRGDVLVWIDVEHFACEVCVPPRKLVWFVDRRNDHEVCMCLPADGRLDELKVAEITARL